MRHLSKRTNGDDRIIGEVRLTEPHNTEKFDAGGVE